jgi:hypothetical protein
MTRRLISSGSSPESIAGMRRIIDRLRPADSGSFLDWQGRVMPW